MNTTRTLLISSAILALACASSDKAPAPKEAAPAATEKKAPAAPEAKAVAAVTPTPAPTAAAVQGTSPTAVIQRYTEELRAIVEIKDPKQRGKKNQTREQSISSKVRNFFDFEELARQSLGVNWAKRTSAERERFSRLFTGLVERSYLNRSRQLVSDYDVKYTNETIKPGHATVTSKVAQRDASVDITYDLHDKSGKWMIYNITLDNVNLVRNYQSQFNQIISQKGFKYLLDTMQKKLNSADDSATTL